MNKKKRAAVKSNVLGMIGRKLGCTRVFDDKNESVLVTVVEILPNHVIQIKSKNKDGYSAVQFSSGVKRRSLVSSPLQGHYAKAKVEPGVILKEFVLDNDEDHSLKIGDIVDVNFFKNVSKVSVTGTSKGKGFAGTVKRYNFRTQDASHGNSLSHRVPGSTGQCQTPGRVLKGKKMAGQLGNAKCTVSNLKIINIDENLNVVLIKGAIPGATKSIVTVKPLAFADDN